MAAGGTDLCLSAPLLEECTAQWKDEYIRLGKMNGKAEGINLAPNELLKARFGVLPAIFLPNFLAIELLERITDERR